MIERKIVEQMKQELDNDLILLLVGARQVGKTTALTQLQHHCQSLGHQTYFFTLEDPRIKQELNQHPSNIFTITGSSPNQQHIIFIDEIQYLDNPTNTLKYLYDLHKDTVKLIVSGSSSFSIDQKFYDSLMGRKRVFNLYTADIEEFFWFKEERHLFDSLKTSITTPLIHQPTRQQLYQEYTIYGGYPAVILEPTPLAKQRKLFEYTTDYIKKDIYDSNIQDQDSFLILLKLLAEQTGSLLNHQELANTLNISGPTIKKYLYIMQKSFHIGISKPFHRNLRKELTKMPKVYFYDNGIRNTLLDSFGSLSQRLDTGPTLENIIRQELIHHHPTDTIKFWRTQAGHEVDFVVNESHAREAKYSDHKFSPKKYQTFIDTYPTIPLQSITSTTLSDRVLDHYRTPHP